MSGEKSITDQSNSLNDTEQTLFSFIYESNYDKLCRTIFLIVGDRETCLDIVQETFVKAMNNIDQLKDFNKLDAWLYTIAVNKARDSLRSKYWNRKWITPFDSAVKENLQISLRQKTFLQPEEAVEKKEIQGTVIKALNMVKYKYREVVVLRYYLGLSEREIAETLQIKEGTVKSRLNRARFKIQQALTRLGRREYGE